MENLTREDFREAENLDEFADTFLERTGETDREFSFEETYEDARENWWTLTRTENNEPTEEIPEYEIETDDGIIHLKGVMHGVSKRFMTAPEDAVDMFNDEVAEKSEYSPVLLEEGFENLLLDDANSMRSNVNETDDIEWAAEQNPFGVLKYFGKQIPKIPLSLAVTKIAPFAEEHSDNRKWDYMSTFNDSMSSVEHWDDLMNAVDANQLPLHLLDEYNADKNPAENLLKEGRSVYQASKAEEKLEESDEVSLYVGMAHAPHIRDYFELEQIDELSPSTYISRNEDAIGP